MPEWLGQTIGKVRIEKYLAHGGMAEVYLGTHLTLDRPVAVKVMFGHVEFDDDLYKRFQREAKAVAGLRHPNIVQVFDFDTYQDQPYIVMEYVTGPALSTYLRAIGRNRARLQQQQIGHLLERLASAIDYAHGKGIIHRDIKPGNILLHNKSGSFSADAPLTSETDPILTDFGLLRLMESETQTITGIVSGTPAYMSPEQARGTKVDQRTDIYSLGVVLYELLSGRLPFAGESSMEIIQKHINEPPPPIEDVSRGVQSVVDVALAKQSTDRFRTAAEFASSFNSATKAGSEASTYRGVSLPPAAPPPVPRINDSRSGRSWATAAIVGGLVLSMGTLAYFKGFLHPTSPVATQSLLDPPIISVTGLPAGLPSSTVGVLRFQDGAAILDKVTVTSFAMRAPAQGSQYEVWLVGDQARISLGMLAVDQEGHGTLSYVDSQSRNLLGIYAAVEVTEEQIANSNSDPSAKIAYTAALPPQALMALRALLVSSSQAPAGNPLAQSLKSDGEKMLQTSAEMLRDFQKNDKPGAQLAAETILNLLVGDQSPDHKDWNSDGELADISDGYGLMPNGNHPGYLQAVFSSADQGANAPDATSNLSLQAGLAKVCVQNIQQWTPVLRERLRGILNSAPGSDSETGMREVVALTDQILNGVDLDGNDKIEPISGECGALTAYEYAYSMADMPLLPVAVESSTLPKDAQVGIGTPTPTASATPTLLRLTSTSSSVLTAVSTRITLPTLLPTDIPLPLLTDVIPSEIPIPPILSTPLLPLP